MLAAEPGRPLSFSKRVGESLKVCLLQPALCVLCYSRLLCYVGTKVGIHIQL